MLVARVAILDENDIYASTAPTLGAPSGLSGLRFHVRTAQGEDQSQPLLWDGISRVERCAKIENENGDIVDIS